MFNINKEEITWNNTPLVIETGHIARQSDGAVMITYGETTILCTAVFSKDNNPNVDFLPLSVDYQEKYYASGRIPGGFFKREGRPTEKEIVISRLIDRPLRPLFPEGFQHETQILATVLSYDNTNLTDIPSIIGCSAALCISGIPVEPIGAARIGYKNEKYILNPSKEELKSSQLDLIIVGTKESILMVETEAHELPEKIILEAIKFGHEQIQPIVDIIAQLSTKVNISQHDFANRDIGNDYSIQKILIENYKEQISELYNIKQKKDRELKLTTLRNKAIEDCSDHIDNVSVTDNIVLKLLKKLEKKIIRDQIIRTSTRIDGRNEDTIRPIESKINILKRTHGSALFTRGETQSLAVTTLGTGHDEQIVDAIGGEYRERFMLHYNFPGYAVGEIGRNMSPKRREIGHGKLAWKALNQVLPKSKEFPYTIRVVSEITESNGSSSMATVCSSSLSLMSAGVPLSRPVAGIAMGLIQEEKEKFIILSDIIGDEDYLGDMDFKVAGTSNGITALQMDIKIKGLKLEVIESALNQAKKGRIHILEEMGKTLNTHNEIGRYAPKIANLNIPQEKIREVIGSGGKTIRDICEKTNAKVDISNEGLVKISAEDTKSIDEALKRIKEIVSEPEVGQIYKGKVVKIMEFGAFVNFLGPRDGLVHISELTQERIKKVTDITKEGDFVYVQLVGFDRGKARLSMKVVDQKTGKSISRMSIESSS